MKEDKLPIGNIVRNHTLKGKNRGTSIKRPPDILYQGTESYESWNNGAFKTQSKRMRAWGALTGV